MTNEAEERAAFFNDNAVCGNCGLTRGEHAREAFDYKTLTINDNNVTWVWPYEACPVGPQPFHSDKAFVAARAAAPVSAPTLADDEALADSLAPALWEADKWWYKSRNQLVETADWAGCVLMRMMPKIREVLREAPVSAEQPTRTGGLCATCHRPVFGPGTTIASGAYRDGTAQDMFCHCIKAYNTVAAPSVAEDSATQPMLTVLDHKYISEVCHEKGCQYLVLSQPGSEDWMRKAAETAAYKLYPPTKYCTDNAVRCNAEAIIREEIAKHFAASQLSTEKK